MESYRTYYKIPLLGNDDKAGLVHFQNWFHGSNVAVSIYP